MEWKNLSNEELLEIYYSFEDDTSQNENEYKKRDLSINERRNQCKREIKHRIYSLDW